MPVVFVQLTTGHYANIKCAAGVLAHPLNVALSTSAPGIALISYGNATSSGVVATLSSQLAAQATLGFLPRQSSFSIGVTSADADASSNLSVSVLIAYESEEDSAAAPQVKIVKGSISGKPVKAPQAQDEEQPAVVSKADSKAAAKAAKQQQPAAAAAAAPAPVAAQDAKASQQEKQPKEKAQQEQQQQQKKEKVNKTESKDDSSSSSSSSSEPITTPSGLRYQDVKVGSTNATVRTGHNVSIRYKGMLPSGIVFDTNMPRGQPLDFKVGSREVVAGMEEGVIGMKPGGLRRLVIPPKLGYGSKGAGSSIPPNSYLVFDVELVRVY